MKVPFTVQVPVGLALDLKDKLKTLQAAHDVDLGKVDKKITLADGDPKKLVQTRDALVQRGRLLTMNNMITLAMEHGAKAVKVMKDEQIFKHLAETGVTRGRPRNAA